MKAKELALGILSMTMTTVSMADYIVLGTTSESNGTSGYSGTLMKLNVGEYSYLEEISIGPNDYSSVPDNLTIYMGITGITWSENSDKPCEIKASAYALDPTKSSKQTSKSKKLCSGSTGNSKTVKFSASRNALRGIAVCTTNKKSSSKDRLKGIRIYPARVNEDGSLTNLNTYEEVRHTNCGKWFSPVYCPSGYIASGLKIYHNGDWFRGLGLKCRQVNTANSPYKP